MELLRLVHQVLEALPDALLAVLADKVGLAVAQQLVGRARARGKHRHAQHMRLHKDHRRGLVIGDVHQQIGMTHIRIWIALLSEEHNLLLKPRFLYGALQAFPLLAIAGDEPHHLTVGSEHGR